MSYRKLFNMNQVDVGTQVVNDLGATGTIVATNMKGKYPVLVVYYREGDECFDVYESYTHTGWSREDKNDPNTNCIYLKPEIKSKIMALIVDADGNCYSHTFNTQMELIEWTSVATLSGKRVVHHVEVEYEA